MIVDIDRRITRPFDLSLWCHQHRTGLPVSQLQLADIIRWRVDLRAGVVTEFNGEQMARQNDKSFKFHHVCESYLV